jgi:hypothetical protein
MVASGRWGCDGRHRAHGAAMKNPDANRWQIKSDDDTGPGWASLQILREKPKGTAKVLCWILLTSEQLREVSAAALTIADHMDGVGA